ncbi:MAG: TIGR00730 family Rossman fold protein [bacterium]|nr:MAG: TIGR00730 family Rossman fold protein [bacterium]
MKIQKICVYCASSSQTDQEYFDAADRLGRVLAKQGITIVYGGGSQGSMGYLADAALSEGGKVIGVIPDFMVDLEWSHEGLSELQIVNDLHQRKSRMIEEVDAVIALPGGCGTLEELLEAITWKRLGIFLQPIVLVNIRRFFDPLIELFENIIQEKFMDKRHHAMWTVVDKPENVLDAIKMAPKWNPEARYFAAI